MGALEQAKDYSKEFQDAGVNTSLIFSTDGKTFSGKILQEVEQWLTQSTILKNCFGILQEY